MTWAMVPSHTSGLCACTYHFFYNSPLVSWIVLAQAALTVIGNTAMATAAYRIFKYEDSKGSALSTPASSSASTPTSSEDGNDSQTITDLNLGEMFEVFDAAEKSVTAVNPVFSSNTKIAELSESTYEFWFQTFVKSVIAAAVVKYGELLLDVPFEPYQSEIAVALIVIPTLLNVFKWYSRSNDAPSPVSLS